MISEEYDFAKHVADNLETILIKLKDDPDELLISARNILGGFKEGFNVSNAPDGAKMIERMVNELEEKPDQAALILYKLLHSMRLYGLQILYKEAVEPNLKTKADLMS